jgi:hypothetical protein
LRSAALKLDGYLRTPNARFGIKNAPSEAVQAFQHIAGIAEDGILGPSTRKAASSVGVTFPPRGAVEPQRQAEPAISQSLLNAATASGASTTQAKNAQSQQIAAVQTGLGVVPTGRLDPETQQQAAVLGVTLPALGSTTAHNPFGAHSCDSAIDPKYDPIRNALASFSSARPDYLFASHQVHCLNGLTSVLTSGGRGGWNTARLNQAKTGWAALGPLNLSSPTASWLYESRAALKPFDAQMKKVTGAADSAARRDSLKASITTPSSGAWWYVLALVRLEDMLRPLLDINSFSDTGLLTPNSSVGEKSRNLAENMSAAVNSILKANPQADPIAIMIRLFLKASSLQGMADAAMKANGALP